jgi:hypothetical protein
MPDSMSSKTIDLQDRDFAVLRGLFDCRVMTIRHIATLYFDGKAEAAKKRIQKLKAASFLAERPRRHHEPSILTLTRLGFEALAEHGRLAGLPETAWADVKGRLQVSELTLRHELGVMDVKAAMFRSLRQSPGTEIAEFATWPALIEFEASSGVGAAEVVVKPDGFIRIRETDATGDVFEHTFYLELDRSTEAQETLVSRCACYVDYYRRGGLAVRNGRPASDYKDFPFRTLIILKSAERRNNTAERLLLLQPPILSQVWLTTVKEVLSDAFGQIWIRPLDYRTAIMGSAFEAGHLPSVRGYHRDSEREAFVEMKIKKHKLLGVENEGQS